MIADKMAAKIAVYCKNIRKSSLRQTKSRDLHAKCLFYWSLIYKHHPCDPSGAIYATLSIWYVENGAQDRSWHILLTRGSGTLPEGNMVDL